RTARAIAADRRQSERRGRPGGQAGRGQRHCLRGAAGRQCGSDRRRPGRTALGRCQRCRIRGQRKGIRRHCQGHRRRMCRRAGTGKSVGTGGAAALNRAMPAAQYIEVPNVPAKLCALVEVSGCEPAMTDTMLGELVVCCGSTMWPGEVTVIAWLLPCPAMKPTARSLDVEGVTVPELA